MDICMQVSYSETFNIVAADSINLGIPTVVSDEISWTHPSSFANPNDTIDIKNKLINAWQNKHKHIELNKKYLIRYVDKSAKTWIEYLK